jgi:hypothetical protein
MPEPTPTNMTAPEHQGPAALLARLISIDSANPDLGPGAGEAVIADFAGEWLTARGFEVHRLEQRRGRPSIVAVAHGSGGGHDPRDPALHVEGATPKHPPLAEGSEHLFRAKAAVFLVGDERKQEVAAQLAREGADARDRGDAGHPHPDPGSERERLRGTGDRDDPG